MMKIKQIWAELEQDKSFSKGMLFRRFSGDFMPSVFIALQYPQNFYCIAASISTSIDVNIFSFSNLQEIQVELFPDINNSGKNILVFKLLNSQHQDIFAVLCEDLILSISDETNEQNLVRSLLNRFEKWKSIFSKIISQGLSQEEQRGLYGELYFLRKFLLSNTNHQNIISSWVGVSKEVRDFQLNDWAVEVKTTVGNNHQKVQINSERQLDSTLLRKLYLYHISLEKVQESGESLPQIVSSVKTILEKDTLNLNSFKAKLFEGGYFDQHEALYSNVGYFIRQDNFFLIENEFPRIQESELRNGIGDVKYSIILSQCQEYLQPELQVFQNLTIL